MVADLEVVLQSARCETAEKSASSLMERYGPSYPKAVAALTKGLEKALTYTAFPSGHRRYIRTANRLEGLFRKVRRRTRVVGVSPDERRCT